MKRAILTLSSLSAKRLFPDTVLGPGLNPAGGGFLGYSLRGKVVILAQSVILKPFAGGLRTKVIRGTKVVILDVFFARA